MMSIEDMKDVDICLFQLPDSTMTVINNLNSIFKGSNDNKQYNKPYSKQERNDYNKNKNSDVVNTTQQPITPKFLSATKRQADVGIQRDIKEITLLMNKMTDKNYDKISNDLFESFEYVFTEYIGNNELEKITDNLNNTIKHNSAYSGVYSKFYKILVNKYGNLFVNGLKKINTAFEESLDNMWYIDSDEDYDKYCEMNQSNKTRKSLLIFITKLVMNEYYDKQVYCHYVNLIINKIEKSMELANSTPLVEELGEVLYDMLISSDLETIKTFDCWETVHNFAKKMKAVSPKDVKSFSMRCKFKYMDMNDYLNGKKK